jgi:hypothetical protein
MAWETSVLVVANVTADSDELLNALHARRERGPLRITLLVPQRSAGSQSREAARGQLAAALERLRGAGLEADGHVGDCDPIVAVEEAWDPRKFDEVIVSTLTADASRWLALDLPHRIQRHTGAAMTHVVATPKRPLRVTHPDEPPERRGIFSPLQALPWSAPKGDRGRR